MATPVVIYCDFDGTITQDDVVDVLLTQLADPRWRDIEAEWQRGLIGSRECLARQIPLIQGGWAAIAQQLESMTLDPTFPPFAAWCASRGIPLRIVSDGLDRVIHTLLARQNIVVDAVWANHLEESVGGTLSITFPYPSQYSDCQAGLCKCQILSQTAPAMRRVVIGDGRSDLCWASEAQWLFAKSELLAYCRRNHIRCRPFENFHTIRKALTVLLDRPQRSSMRPARAFEAQRA